MKKIYRSFSMALVLFFLLVSVAANAQKRNVSGTITDPSSTGMPGVNIIIKGTTVGTSTDSDGKFTIEASDDDVLTFSFIGFQTQEMRVGSQTTINVTMVEDVALLGEVVVVGYGTQKKSDLTGAVASVSGETIRNAITTSVDQALLGRAAGVQVTQNSGQPGGVVSIRIRGTTSLTQSNEPLYVIDGIQVGGQASGVSGFDWQGGSGGQQEAASNVLASINPSDIESIEVLKDASATAIYGSRAANGVIMVTTKRGRKGEAKVSYNGYYALQEVYKTFDMMDLPAYAAYNNEVADEVSTIEPNQNFADPSLLGRGTDWQDAVFRVAPMQSHTLTVSGGSDNVKYMVSGGYFTQDGIIIGSNFERFNVRTNIEGRVKDVVTIGANIAFSRRDETIVNSDGGDGIISQAAQMGPNIPVRNFDGTFAGPSQQELSAQVGQNPVAMALLRNNTVLGNRLMSNLYGDVNIIKGLTFRSEISFDLGTTLNKAFQPTYQWGRIENTVSKLQQRQDLSFFWLWKNYATYDRSFGKHNFTLMAGIEAQKGRWENMVITKFNVPNNFPVVAQGDVNENFPPVGQIAWNTLYSQFTRLNYNFNDRYLLTATVRRDGSSRFGSGNRFGVFPMLSAAWRISNEGFFPQTDAVTNVKLRFGWGKTGNQEIDNYAFGSSLITQQSYFGPFVRNNAYSNPNVQWESTAQTNIGLDLELLGGRIDLSAEVYNKLTDNLLLQVPLPAIFGDQVGGPMANVGKMENKGFEVSVSSVNIDKDKFRWSTTANISVNRNKVTEMQSTTLFRNIYWYTGFETASMTRAGYPVGQFYGYVSEGLFTSAQEILEHAVQIESDGDASVNKIERTTGVWLGDIKWKDLNNDGRITSADQTVIGDPNPDFTFGFNNSFTYGPFSLDVFVIGTVGGDILNYSRVRNEQMLANYDNQSVTVQNRARTQLAEGGTDPDNIYHLELVDPTGTMPRFDNGGDNNNHYMSDRWIEDGTYVRIQNIQLGYTLPSSLVRKAKMSRFQVYASVQNAATFTKYTGLDPQIGAFNQSPLQQNVDIGRYPLARVFTFGVNVDF
jgi:TonB-dependent starch-binding outer membrane protein SusC